MDSSVQKELELWLCTECNKRLAVIHSGGKVLTIKHKSFYLDIEELYDGDNALLYSVATRCMRCGAAQKITNEKGG